MFSSEVRFIFFATFLALTITDDTSEEERTDCGQYGFRCLDERSVEFCPIEVDGVTERGNVHNCDDDFVCDEDNPAYCTPREPKNKFLQGGNKDHAIEGAGIDAYDDVYFDDSAQYSQARFVRENREDDDENTTEVVTTMEPDEENDFTTVEFTTASPFECDTYGFFADKTNSTLFWYCDVPPNGVGFLLRHMICGRERFFDDTLKNCIIEGTVRKERKNTSGSKRKNVKTSLSCINKKPGKYADKTNCHVYHLCLPKQFTPAIQLTFMCPNGTAYDSKCQSCTMDAFNRCEAKNQSPSKNQINCRLPTRFRSIDDCSSYYLCFVDNVIAIKCPKFYKFDDNALECLPEKSAECKEYV